MSDFWTFAYLSDVFVIPEFRDLGPSKRLMQEIVDYPALGGLRRWLLATRDAHGLYSQFSFEVLKFPERWMEKTAAAAY